MREVSTPIPLTCWQPTFGSQKVGLPGLEWVKIWLLRTIWWVKDEVDVAIMTDTDNTGEAASVYYGDIVFKHAP